MIYTIYSKSGEFCRIEITNSSRPPIITDDLIAIEGEFSPYTRLVNGAIEEFSSNEISEIDTENEFKKLRSQRNQLLIKSDWTQVLDAPVDRDAWAIYRQALRDLPNNTIDPKNPQWPTPPS